MASDAITGRGGGAPSQLRGEVPRSLAEPRERLEMLCDPGSFRTLRSGVLSRNIEGQPGDGVLVGVGRVRGRPLVCYAEDPSFMGLHAALTAAYAQEHLIADVAAASGFVDEVIEPAETRERLAWALTARAGR